MQKGAENRRTENNIAKDKKTKEFKQHEPRVNTDAPEE
jgi:hypothetical protein